MGVVTGIQREPIWTSTGCTSHEFLLYLPISHPWLGNRQCASTSRVWCWGRTCDGPGARLKSFSNPYNCVMREILSSIPFFEWRNWASEKQKKKSFKSHYQQGMMPGFDPRGYLDHKTCILYTLTGSIRIICNERLRGPKLRATQLVWEGFKSRVNSNGGILIFLNQIQKEQIIQPSRVLSSLSVTDVKLRSEMGSD